MSFRDRVRMLLFFTPHVSIPLALLGVFLTLATPVVALVPYGWLASVAGVAAALALSLRMRSRYRLFVLDSSPLGIVTWLRRRQPSA
jgi:hypothetical protein